MLSHLWSVGRVLRGSSSSIYSYYCSFPRHSYRGINYCSLLFLLQLQNHASILLFLPCTCNEQVNINSLDPIAIGLVCTYFIKLIIVIINITRLKFPVILLLYYILYPIILDISFCLIGRKHLLCSSSDLTEAMNRLTSFCTFSGEL